MQHSIEQTRAFIRTSLTGIYPEGEINALIRVILEEIGGLEPYQILLGKDREISDTLFHRIHEVVDRLHEMEPLQYILGHSVFCGMELEVSPAVLIPRPETEELVEKIVAHFQGMKSRILDIGTGSGCIAIALSHLLSDATVTALDVSQEALEVAQKNNRRNHTDVRFLHADILQADKLLPNETFDGIVSNPPYVMEKEKETMSENVLDHEPHIALFVPDDDPLLFYRAIARFACQRLTPGGSLFFEINPLKADATVEMLRKLDYKNIEVMKDLSGKERMLKAEI